LVLYHKSSKNKFLLRGLLVFPKIKILFLSIYIYKNNQKREMKKTLTVFTVLLLVSTIGFTAVYGYGSTPRRSSGGGSGRATTVITPAAQVVATTPAAGLVLGESTFAFTTDLRMGMQSDAVRELQERLRAEGFFTFPTSTGYFGPITFAAVKAYQQAKGIPFVTGFVGPLTRAELNK
jgi:hypothetical protein